jgi:signal transduction histidine kinase/CheY-like chemotaxis protein/HPt (histidine-containing phosphotransfer) domain-containing protein
MIDTPRYKELQEQMALQTDEKGRIDILVDIAVEVRNFDVDGASIMADDIIERSKALGYRRGMGRGSNLKGSCYWLKGEYDAGLEVLKQALAIATGIKDRRLEARVLYYFGNIYRDMGDFANVLTNFEKALAIYEELGDEFSQSVILTSVSNLLYDLNDFDSALEYALKCLPIFERAHNVSSLINIYNTLGNIYFKKEQFGEALGYFEKNLNYSEPETPNYVMAESGLGKVYYKMQNFADADKFLSSALLQSKELSNAEVQIICNFYLGRLYMDEGNYRKAQQYLNAAYTLAGDYMRKHDIMSIHEVLATLYDKMGDIPKAFYHLKSFEQLKEEIFKQTIINELRNLQVRQQLELAQKEKEVAERTAFLKHQFMANMSHEIRTPMNAIVGMTRLLLDKEPKPDQLRYLNAIRLSADNLLVIINDILDLSKIEAGKIVIEHTDFSMREVVNSVRDMLMLKAEEKGIEMRVAVEETIPRRLIGDPTRVNQILINLAGNAVKFTDKGYVEIKISTKRKDAGKWWLQLDVIDSGIGIAPEYVDSIFDSFTQAGSDVTRKFGGTGLGLTISRQLTNLMGGEISVRSVLQKGTTFSVVIPFVESASQEEKAKESLLDKRSMQRLNHLRILLVEDNEFNRMVAEDTLAELIPGVDLHCAVNGQEAVDRVSKENFDVVLMDIQMPVMDGVTATKAIRRLPQPFGQTKIIAMTANVLQEDVQQYFDAGMNAYVSKPFQPNELLLKMNEVTSGATPVTESRPDAHKKERGFPPLPDRVTDMQFLKQFTGGNPEKQQKYVKMFLENAPKLLDSIAAGLKNKDNQTIKIAAHSLKPQLSYMGVKEEVSNIFMIEQSAGEAAHFDTLPPLFDHLKKVCSKAFEELKVI